MTRWCLSVRIRQWARQGSPYPNRELCGKSVRSEIGRSFRQLNAAQIITEGPLILEGTERAGAQIGAQILLKYDYLFSIHLFASVAGIK
jgi:hypothetical protein